MPHRLEEYYAKIEALMAEGDAWMVDRDPSHADRVRRRVSETALIMTSYQLFVHREVFAPLLDGADPAQRARINELKVECIALTEDLRFNVKDFVARPLDETLDWDVVGSKIAWFNARVRAHIANVRQMMAPGLSDAEHARLRAMRTGPVGLEAA